MDDEPTRYELGEGDVVFFSGRGPKSLLIAAATLPRATYVAIAIGISVALLLGGNLAGAVCGALAVLAVRLAFDRRISHCGVVAAYNDRYLLFESTTLCDLPCAILGRRVKGGQAHRVRERIDGYQGRVYVMRLRTWWAPRPHHSQALTQTLQMCVGLPYSTIGAAISGTTFLKHWWRAPMQHGLHSFCSYLVAGALKRARLFPLGIRSAAVHPAGLARTLADTDQYAPIERLK